MMSFNQMTHRQARTLAQFVNALRGDWDTPGIEDALGRARHLAPAGDLAIAAIKAAGNPAARTPAIIALEGPHWRGSQVTPQRKYDPTGTCATCSQSEATCRARWAGDHEFLAVARKRAVEPVPPPDEVRAAIKSPELCRHGVVRDHCAEHDPRRNQSTPKPVEETEDAIKAAREGVRVAMSGEDA